MNKNEQKLELEKLSKKFKQINWFVSDIFKNLYCFKIMD